MKKNKKIGTLAGWFIVIVFLGLAMIPTQAMTEYAHDIQEGQSHIWRIQYITPNLIAWWDSRGFQGNFKANENTLAVFDITTIAEDIAGNFQIGNLTLQGVNDSDIASALALSIWPWFPGLISHLNWSKVIAAARAANTGWMQGNLTVVEYSEFILFSYQQNQTAGQNTTLVYDLKTGLLMSAYTAYGNYYLGIVYEGLLTNQDVIGVESLVWIILTVGLMTIIVYLAKTRKPTGKAIPLLGIRSNPT
ncbi:MAG: hypothetical protein ACTSRS_17280 [Candidatus Helarchaeota archaeon]